MDLLRRAQIQHLHRQVVQGAIADQQVIQRVLVDQLKRARTQYIRVVQVVTTSLTGAAPDGVGVIQT
ncbi:hypothetical protein [Desulfosporosinus sp. SB140]|uniref:hypothetical protein n=1 Tax=Desulfosporosinus paludis TaxID=3115649 RepID=UPI00388D8EA0